jgi:hypothetical protein
MATQKTLPPCLICGDPTTKVCNKCSDIKVCSRECQETHHDAHKLLCGKIKDIPARPSEDHRRVLYFPPGGSKPVFLWLETKTYQDEEQFTFQQPNTDDQFGVADAQFDVLKANPITGIGIGHEVNICYVEGFEKLYSTENQAVLAATGTKNKGQRSWRGPIVAFSLENVEKVVDISMGDYWHVIAYLLTEENTSMRIEELKGPKVDAVKITCDEAVNDGKERFQAVKLPRFHPAITQYYGEISEISKVCEC